MDSSCYGFFIEGSQGAQVDDLNSATLLVNDISCRAASFQDHRAPTDDSHTGWSLAQAQATSLAKWQGIVPIWDIPVFSHGGDDIATIVFRGFRAIETATFEECDGRL